MAEVPYDKFSDAVEKTMLEFTDTEAHAAITAAVKKKGRNFNFVNDGGMDSLDMLDIMFDVSKTLDVRMPTSLDDDTMGELYGTMCTLNEAAHAQQ